MHTYSKLKNEIQEYLLPCSHKKVETLLFKFIYVTLIYQFEYFSKLYNNVK